ncbi:extracellular serine/threonine protein kinase four-jointed-like [Homarus americanus]|uniref:Extracellular serine/threonine protein kinase four-jointed-like 1 n=1 Tax=Homarus americanus TaxID=6706 RepID=A0A8J5MJA2_HOMAM|nr:extracellular serine/threonine protein kinase four-jointed-like [Homarus americanus]XP_042209739.1 extracellular serine/threonine protein kinase four-jointed-like [Homarus americanus]KAG7153290.1 Extracellular serine/threonine protein kinase four-jointed-like 1 [Homarus americanus]
MIVVNSIMASPDSPRLNLATASRDFLTTVDYPLRPVVSRTWGKPFRTHRRWSWCYFPQSFPVYRMQRLVSVVLCLLGLLLLSLVAFVLVQVTPTTQVLRGGGLMMAAHTRNNGLDLMSVNDNTKWDVGLGVGRTVRKLEDHPEYKRSVEDDYTDDDDDDFDDDEDDLILNDSYDEDYDNQEDDEYNPVFDMKYFDFSVKEEGGDNKRKTHTSQQEEAAEDRSTFKTPTVRETWKNLPQVNLISDYGLEVVVEGVVFSPAVEALLLEPEISDATVGRVQERLRSQEVTGLKEPTWERCGRPKNQWVELVGGGAACARYRYPDDYLLVGEVVSFYLSRLLGVGHVPPVALSEPTQPRWSTVAPQMARAGWGDAPVVVLTPWVHGLVRDHMPSILLDVVLKNSTLSILEEEGETQKEEPEDGLQGHKLYKVANIKDQSILTKTNVEKEDRRDGKQGLRVTGIEDPKTLDLVKESNLKKGRTEDETQRFRITGIKDQVTLTKINDGDLQKKHTGEDEMQGLKGRRSLKQAAERDLVRLLQWSDLLVFDYLTGNYDRVAYMQDAAEKEGRPQILSGTIHNLVRSEATDALWLLDNESGLMDAYTLLYGTADPAQSSRFLTFHTRMLESMCIFRRSTMEAILGLIHHPEPQNLLVEFVKAHEPLFHKLPDPKLNDVFVKYFPQRVAQVHDWMAKCVASIANLPHPHHLHG